MAKYNWLKQGLIISTVIFSAPLTLTWSAEPDHFRQYRYSSDGFEAAFPQKPIEFRADRGPENGFVNSYQAAVINPISQYSVFVSHSPKRVFADASIDAYLESIVRGLTTASNDPVVKYSRRTKFLGFPAIEYEYVHKLDGTPVVGRGLVFILDGEHIRLSQVHVADDTNADTEYRKFTSSFRLMPIDINLGQRFDDRARGIAFSIPDGWLPGTPEFAQVAAIFSNPSGHSITVLDSSTPGYLCDHYRAEIQTTQRVQETGISSAHGRPVASINSTAYNQAAGIRMTSAHYCINTNKGAVVMVGMAPEKTFFRSQTIFQKVASSMAVRK
jgi:hypothetical protein